MRIADCGMGERREAQPDLSQGCQARELAPQPTRCGVLVPNSAIRVPHSAISSSVALGWERGAAGCLAQLFVKRTQALWNNPGATCHCHEVMVAWPSWHDMEMQMRFHACSGRGTEIPSDVECFGLHYLPQQTLRINRKVDQFEFFCCQQL